ncbi:MAG: response regulator [Peptococcaceae bacterium]|nr:response regulator [Peptococcaceae bacterium]
MIKAVLIDDERPALHVLEYFLKDYPEIEISGIYTNPLEAIDAIKRLQPHVAFIDINMPQLQGIDAAARILDASAGTDIVFVTAFDQYAIEAFELYALDYMLKPVNKERLERTVERLKKKKQPLLQAVASSSLKLQIRSFGRFRISWENREPIKWRAGKTKELFVFLLHNHNRPISKDVLLDTLWPEENTEKSIKQLYNGIYYIRKALEAYGVKRTLLSIDSDYNMTLGDVEWDVQRFDELAQSSHFLQLADLKKIEEIYTHDYLAGEFYAWSDLERERLARTYEKCILRLAQILLEAKEYDQTEELLRKAFRKNPYNENVTELLLKLFRQTHNQGEALKHFKTYAEILMKDLGVLPVEGLKEYL